MDTSDNSFFLSRKNFVGMIIAVMVLFAHLAFGLGFLWPLVAFAGWGAGVALTPAPRRAELPAAPDPPTADELLARLDASAEKIYSAGSAPEVVDSMAVLRGSLLEVLAGWDRLSDVPEQRVVVETMITDYVPGIVAGYLGVRERNHPTAVAETAEALDILADEVKQIWQAVVTDTIRELEDHTRALRIQFGRPPAAGYDA